MRRQAERLGLVARRIEFVKARFSELVADFDTKSPFRRAGQLESHLRTMSARRSAGSVRAALAGDAFITLLYITLQKWGIGKRRSKLMDAAPFAESLRCRGPQIEALERFAVDDPALDAAGVAGDIYQVIETLGITENKALLVACTKTLHHLLPELVVPMDRKFTQWFFGWAELQSHHREHFREAFAAFADIARTVNPQQYVGTQKWHSSRTKVLDNAIVSAVVVLRGDRTAEAGAVQGRNPGVTPPTADSFRAALAQLLQEATTGGQQSVRITAGELDRKVGGYPRRRHRMPVCCNVMKAEMDAAYGDAVVKAPPSGQGASLTIEYRLPRPRRA
jgi:hypothetical protein